MPAPLAFLWLNILFFSLFSDCWWWSDDVKAQTYFWSILSAVSFWSFLIPVSVQYGLGRRIYDTCRFTGCRWLLHVWWHLGIPSDIRDVSCAVHPFLENLFWKNRSDSWYSCFVRLCCIAFCCVHLLHTKRYPWWNHLLFYKYLKMGSYFLQLFLSILFGYYFLFHQ